MKKNYALFSMLFVAGILLLNYFLTMPQWVSAPSSRNEFSTERALKKIEKIAAQPHFVGSKNHEVVANYLVSELKKLGLNPEIQEGTTFSGKGNLVKSKNILARIQGTNNSKALLLLTHYDSAPHSYSHGASDAGSGVGTLLEGIRAFLHAKKTHKNDIVILFSDAEELGLNGAALFVTQHHVAKEIGLVLNFEARGTSGPSYMLMEVNKGNAALVDGFSKANVPFPVSNSLMYSIYKMLPNDTDLTVFREQGKIQGFNFAFIDNHFNYHTAQDDFQHISPNTIEHQGTYLMPLLHYFSNADLTKVDAVEDYVNFNVPFSFVSYPFSWVFPMVWIATFLLLFFVFIGFGKRILNGRTIITGFGPLLGSLLVSGMFSYFGWKLLLKIYPQYNDIQQGFPYNGHAYIWAFICLSLAVCFSFYSKYKPDSRIVNLSIAPLFLWIILNFAIASYLPGAGFFSIPVLSCLVMLGYFVSTQKSNSLLNLFLSIPALLIFFPLITMLPIGLGLKILVGSSVLTVLVFGLLLPVFGMFPRKRNWAILFFMASIGFIVYAHFHSGYERGKAKTNSLLYVYDADTEATKWATYDANLDEWTKTYLGENPESAAPLNNNPLYSKYHSEFTFMADAPKIAVSKPTIEFLKDSLGGNLRYITLQITPNRTVNRYDIYASNKMSVSNLVANGATSIGQSETKNNVTSTKILTYYVVNNEPLELQFSIYATSVFDMNMIESSFDLLTNSTLKIRKRLDWMMPMPFVITDALILKQKIIPSVVVDKKNEKFSTRNLVVKDSLINAVDTLKTK